MADYLQDYKDYYRVRAERYAHDPDYSESYAAEKNLYGAIDSCNELGEFKSKLGNLNELCAVALTRDEYKIRQKHYIEIKETVRAKGPERIIEKAAGIQDVNSLITMVGEEENKNMIEISMDDTSFFMDCWNQLDEIEVYETAEVPDQYKAERKKFADEIRAKLKENYHDVTNERRKWQPDWQFNFDLIWEERHRRQIPYTDDQIKEKITILKNIIA